MKPALPCAVRARDPVELLILRILRKGLAGTLVSGALGVGVGCSDDNLSAEERGFVRAECAGSWPPISAAGLKPAESYDYVGLISRSAICDSYADGVAQIVGRRVLSETGARCGGAIDNAACESELALEPPFVEHARDQLCDEYRVVTTRGDDVKSWATEAETLALLGAIDSPDEALLLALRAGYALPCAGDGQTQHRAAADGFDLLVERVLGSCQVTTQQIMLHVSGDGALTTLQTGPRKVKSGVCIGRVPGGLVSESREVRTSALGDYLAECAHLEEASVYAFERLARELTSLGAPRELVAAALHAADDEVRHTRVMSSLARTCGGEPVAARVEELPLRSLEEVALENAVEGCVHETFGALLGGYQARHAAEPRVRAAMREIAADEARHAALAQRVHTWALAQLDEPARERVLAARRAAVRELLAACAHDERRDVRVLAGLPAPTVALALARALNELLWGDAEAPAGRSVAREARASGAVV